MSATALRCLLTSFVTLSAGRAVDLVDADVCIYGGTAAGVIAAVQVVREGRTAVIVEPSLHLGGLTTGGLGATDIGNKAAIGGLSREFYQRIAGHYAADHAWRLERREDYFGRNRGGQAAASTLAGTNATMWTFEPRVAEDIFWRWINDARIPVHLGHSLVSVRTDHARIRAFTSQAGRTFQARVFIDATYEGDLLAKAGVSFHVGREANAIYGERLNGICAETPKHQFSVAVDPFIKPQDPTSGLLPFVRPPHTAEIPGNGDSCVQAYNFRLCFTTDPANRRPVEPPPHYDPAQFELLGRYLEALTANGKKPTLAEFWNPIALPNHKTDINNNGGFSTDFIGMNYDYPNADEPARARIRQEHEFYIRGFITYLSTSPRVPEPMRREMQSWGMAADEFLDTGGWPHQLYVREARRMISDVVMTENHCRGLQVVDDSVGLAAYNMDSHNCRRIVRNGRAENEGDVQVPPMKPYAISFRSIVPRAAESENLLVPVCLSASHIAYGSIRMEPVFMILGQSAATAAVQSIRERRAVQQIDYAKLRKRLVADAQILEWRPIQTQTPSPAPLPPTRP